MSKSSSAQSLYISKCIRVLPFSLSSLTIVNVGLKTFFYSETSGKPSHKGCLQRPGRRRVQLYSAAPSFAASSRPRFSVLFAFCHYLEHRHLHNYSKDYTQNPEFEKGYCAKLGEIKTVVSMKKYLPFIKEFAKEPTYRFCSWLLPAASTA